MHQNRASPFASDFCRRRGYRREFRSESHFYPFYSQKKSRFASDFLRRGNRAPWGLKKSRDFLGSGKNRRRSRRESRDFGALKSRYLFCRIEVVEVSFSVSKSLFWYRDCAFCCSASSSRDQACACFLSPQHAWKLEGRRSSRYRKKRKIDKSAPPSEKSPLDTNSMIAWHPLQKCVVDLCCINIGGFCRGFSWRIFLGTFSHKNEEEFKFRRQNPRKNDRRPKNKNPRKIRSAKNRA